MKILVYGINFSPEKVGVGRYTSDMAAWLAADGHEVRAVTALPYYPEWKVAKEYGPLRYVREKWKGVEVWRAPLWVPSRPSGLKRVLHLASFAVTTIPLLVRLAFWRPAVVWLVAPAFACAPGALLLARATGAKSWIHIQDFEIDVAFEMGMLKGEVPLKVLGGLERWLFRRFDMTSSISGPMLQRLTVKGVPTARIASLPNWVDLEAITPLLGPSRYRAELGIPDDAIVALYSGSMGLKQAVDILAEVAVRLRGVERLFFVFVGEGPLKSAVHEACAHLPTVRCLPLQPIERLGELLGLADIHLLPQRPAAADMVLPSKLTGMLSSGRPVVTSAHNHTELATVVGQCGVVVPPEDSAAFADAVHALANDAARRTELGRLARQFAELHLGQAAILGRFVTQLQAMQVTAPVAVPVPGSGSGSGSVLSQSPGVDH